MEDKIVRASDVMAKLDRLLEDVRASGECREDQLGTIRNMVSNCLMLARDYREDRTFDFERYDVAVVMHCRTQAEAEIFCRSMDSVGKKWPSGHSYLEYSVWDVHKEDTCYCITQGGFSDIGYAKEHDWKILDFSDFDHFPGIPDSEIMKLRETEGTGNV